MRICIIRFGYFPHNLTEKDYFGIDDFENPQFLIAFLDDEDNATGYALRVDKHIIIENCDLGDLDSATLRNSLPMEFKNLWNKILLCSTDDAEAESENFKPITIRPKEAPKQSTKPFATKKIKSINKDKKIIFVHSIFCNFTWADDLLSQELIKDFTHGNLKNALRLIRCSVGNIWDFDTLSEKICVFSS